MIEAVAAAQGILSELASLASAAGATGDVGTAATAAPATPAPGAAGGASFSDLFNAAVGRLDGDVAGANAAATSFASGSGDIPLSDVMISLEQANLSLQMAGNVREKVTAAYSNIMNMQL